MFKWAWKSLLKQPGNLIGSTLGIAFAFILVVFFDAVWRGESVQIIAYPNNVKPDVWVMQSGVSNMHMAMSFVWDWKADKVAEVPGVKKVTPILYLNTVIVAKQQEMFAFIVGLLPDARRAGPWQMNAGRQVENPKETVIPAVLSKITGVAIGDRIRIADTHFTVVGLSAGTYSSANAILFVPFKDLENILSSTGTYSYLMVDAEEGVDPDQLAQRIMEHVEKVNALPHDEFIHNDYMMAAQMGVEIIFMMTVICSVLAALIVGFTVYSLVTLKRKELAIAKALGVHNSAIFSAVLIQATIVTMAGFILATGFALFILQHIPALVPQLTVFMSSQSLALLGVIAMFVAAVGSLVPAYMIVRLDPATAFQV